MNEELLSSIDRTLKALLGIVVSIPADNASSVRDRVIRLNDLGFKPKEIGQIIGRTGTYVSKELTLLRKSKSKGSK